MPTIPPLTTLAGAPIDPTELDGRALLFVNVASRCGFTPQYAGLEKLWIDRKDQGLTIIGVPCNQFGAQEPGTASEIQEFCRLTYGVSFPLLQKQDVNGGWRSPLYTWLMRSPVGANKDIKWNFEKFLVGRDRTVLARFGSSATPEGPTLKKAIDAALATS